MSDKENKLVFTRESILAEAPELAETFRAEGHATGMIAGATAESERIQAVEAQSMAGHDELISGLKFDGKTTGPEAAVAVLNAERKQRTAAAADYAADAPKPAPFAAAPDDDADANPSQSFDALVQKSVDAGMSRGAAISSVAAKNPEAHAAYLKTLGGDQS